MAKQIPVILLDNSTNQKITFNDQCDCACAYTPCTEASPLALTAPYRVSENARAFPLPGGWTGVHLPDGPAPLAVLNQSAYELWSRFQTPRSSDELTLDTDAQDALRQMTAAGMLVPDQRPHSSFRLHTSTFLSSWLHLTGRCNLRCAYCYLPHVKEDMTAETGCAAVDAIFRSAVKHGYRQVKLKYAGGEPLLRADLIWELHRNAQRLAEENSLALDGVVLSNGTLLTQSVVENLLSLNLRLMISIDGYGEWHDIQRPYAGGRGTFGDVAEAVELAQSSGLTSHLSITVSGRNAEGLPEIIAWVLERELPFSINFYRQNDFSVSHQDLKLDEEKIIAGMQAAFAIIERNLPQHSLLSALTDRANLAAPHLKTCSVGQDYMVFNQHGQVAKCQMKMSETVADVRTDDPLVLIRADQNGVQNLSVEEKEGCRDCQWKHSCAGGCPLETRRAAGRYNVQSPNCYIYKAIFPEVLRLEGLRLMQQAGISADY